VKPAVLAAVAFCAAFLGYLLYSTLHTERVRCRVCITYEGRQDCRTASATTREKALETATVNACGVLTSGVIDSNKCQTTPPDSVEWLK
jgi:hypothetical protein